MSDDYREWMRLMGWMRLAKVEQSIAQDADAPRVDRDLATARLAHLTDRLFEQLDRMSVSGLLGRVALLLAEKEQ